MEFYITVAVALGTVLSLIFHHSHNKKLNEVGDVIDEIKAKAGK